MQSKYILPVRSDICREITKRRVYSHRKDEKTGKIKKCKNPNGTSSPFGWGTVTDTFMLNPKILDNVRRNVGLYVLQIQKDSYLEQEPVVQQSKKKRVISLSPPPDPTKKARVAPLIKSWYEYCNKNLESGSVGLVPDCWAHHDKMPLSLEELLCTQVGKVLQNYTRFVKSKL